LDKLMSLIGMRGSTQGVKFSRKPPERGQQEDQDSGQRRRRVQFETEAEQAEDNEPLGSGGRS